MFFLRDVSVGEWRFFYRSVKMLAYREPDTKFWEINTYVFINFTRIKIRLLVIVDIPNELERSS